MICLDYFFRGWQSVSIFRSLLLGWPESSDQNYSICSPGSLSMAVSILGAKEAQEVGVLIIQNVYFLINLPISSKVSLPSVVSSTNLSGIFLISFPQRVSLQSLPGGWKGPSVKERLAGPLSASVALLPSEVLLAANIQVSVRFCSGLPVNLNFSFMGLHSPSPLYHLLSISQNVIVFFPFLLSLQPIPLLSF